MMYILGMIWFIFHCLLIIGIYFNFLTSFTFDFPYDRSVDLISS